MSLPHLPSVDHSAEENETENELERLLRLAASESFYRPAFFCALLDATVLVLGESGQNNHNGEITFSSTEVVNIQHWEKQDSVSIIPFFSSLKILQQATGQEQPFVAMPVRVLFDLTQGSTLFLNPKSEYGKEFYPQEIAMLLKNGGIAKPTEMTVVKETQILLGQPAEYPAAMVDALIQLFSQRKPVRRAFLALLHDKNVDEKPNLLVGLEVDGVDEEIDLLIQEAGHVASETTPDDGQVDFCLVAGQEQGVSHYLMTHTQPFYQRKWGSWLRNIIPSSG